MMRTVFLFMLVFSSALTASAGQTRMMNLSDFVNSNPIRDLGTFDKIQVRSAAADAENLALLAERLFYTTGFIYVHEVAQEALRLDPNNQRALLYNAIGEVIERSRGLLNRVTPLAKKTGPKAVEGLASLLDSLPQEMRLFSLDGPQDIESSVLLQETFRNVRASMQKLSVLLDSFGSNPLYLNYYELQINIFYWDYWYQQWIKYPKSTAVTSWENCPASRIAKGVYVFEACTVASDHSPYSSSRREVKLVKRGSWIDALDAEGLKTGANGATIYFSLMANAYSFEGLENIAKKLLATSSGRPSERAVIEAIRQEKNFLTVLDQNVLSDVSIKGQEFLDALAWFQSNFSTFCDSELGENRAGHLLGPTACMFDKINKVILVGNQALQGPIEVTRYYGRYNSQSYKTEIDFSKIITASIKDMKTLLPTKFDSCGNSIELPDNALAGLFPRNDFTTFERFKNPNFLMPRCPAFVATVPGPRK